jgi:hypothetical protein
MSQNKTAYKFKLIKILGGLLLFSCSLKSYAYLPQTAQTYPTDMCSHNCDSDETIRQTLIQNFNFVKKYSESNSEKLVGTIFAPEGLVPGDSSQAMNKVADRSVKYFWENSEIKSTAVGHTVETAQKSLQKNVIISAGSTDKKEQKLNFAIDAFQSAARIQYTGYANAELSYQTRDATTGLHIYQKMSKDSSLAIGEVLSPNDQVSQALIKWDW